MVQVVLQVTPLLVVVLTDQIQYFQQSHQQVEVERLVIQVVLPMLLVMVDQAVEDQGIVLHKQVAMVIHLQ